MFQGTITRTGLINMEDKGQIPKARRKSRGKTSVRYWSSEDLPAICERLGYLKKPVTPKVVTFFTQKGGTGKTPLAFQLARTLAIHNIKVLVVGLDPQETITSLLGGKEKEPEALPENLDEWYSPGLYEVYENENTIKEVVTNSDLKNLQYIPENARIAALEMAIGRNPDPLKVFEKQFVGPAMGLGYDYIIFDCNPSWGRIINSVLHTSDVIVSPLACNSSTLKITKVFFKMLSDFETEVGSGAEKLIVPTLLRGSRLSRQVRSEYEDNYSNVCTKMALKESVVFDESQTLYRSIAEYQPESTIYRDLVAVFKEFQALIDFLDSPEEEESEGEPLNKSAEL